MLSLEPGPIDRILAPFREFAGLQASGGIVLMACTCIAMAWANAWTEHYEAFFSQSVAVRFGDAALAKPLVLWIEPFEVLQNLLAVGIVGGLFIGKQLGILGFSWLAVKARLALLF